MRLAAIDIGTNSIHMVIASTTEGGGFEVVNREREVTQIGRGSFRTGLLRPAAIRRTIEALASFVELARRMETDRILCTATAAVREARNGGRFIQDARRRAGITPRVIPGEEEGRLIYLAVRSAVAMDDAPSLILDIGGGSAQFVVGTREKLKLAMSAPLGALRLTEAFLESDPPGRADLRRLEREIRRHAKAPLKAVGEFKPRHLYGSSGSIHALASLAHLDETGEPLEQINGHVLTAEQLQRLTRRLRRMPLEERMALPGIDASRAEILLPGAMVLAHVLATLDAPGITVTDFGVREGLVTDYVAAHPREISTVGTGDDLRMRSVLQLLHKFQPEERHLGHARHVTSLALSLFDGLREEHGLDDAARTRFEYGALLHDVGAVVGYDGHAEHSYYLIRHGNLRGLARAEVEMIALIARYHSRGRPRRREPAVAALSKAHRRELRWLSAMLRIAESLDRSHYQLVRAVRVARRAGRVVLRVEARRGAGLELWETRRRLGLLESLLDARVSVEREVAAERPRRASPALVAVPAERARIVAMRDPASAAARGKTRSPARKSSQRA